MALQLVVLGILIYYLQAGGAIRLLLCGVVILIWLVFFACCELSFRRMRQARPASFLAVPRPDQVKR